MTRVRQVGWARWTEMPRSPRIPTRPSIYWKSCAVRIVTLVFAESEHFT